MLCNQGVKINHERINTAMQSARSRFVNFPGLAPDGPQPNHPQIPAKIKTICSKADAIKSTCQKKIPYKALDRTHQGQAVVQVSGMQVCWC